MNSVPVKVLVVLQLLGAAVVVVAVVAVTTKTPARLLPTVLSEAQIYTDIDSGSENGDSQQRRSTNNGKSNSKGSDRASRGRASRQRRWWSLSCTERRRRRQESRCEQKATRRLRLAMCVCAAEESLAQAHAESAS